jgi:Tfp pilus assembly protein PilN
VPKRINLLPKTERVRTTTNVAALALMAGGLVVVFALGLSYYLFTSDRNSLQDELSGLEEKRAGLEAQVAALDEYKQLAAQVSTTEGIVRGVYAGRTLIAQVLSDFSRAIPENVWLLAMTLGAGDPQTVPTGTEGGTGQLLSGLGSLAIQGNTYSFPDVGLLMVRLKLVSSLQGITLNSAGEPLGEVDTAKNIRGFQMSGSIINTQPTDTPLPMSKVEVEGL